MNSLCESVKALGYAGAEEAFGRLGYRFFDKGSYNVNIFGVRSELDKANKWDDALCIAYRDGKGEMHLDVYQGTTDPGSNTLMNPGNVKGAAILVPNQYRGVWTIGIHGAGRPIAHEALRQTNGAVSVYRDNNRDNKLDRLADTIETGYFGINIHRASRNTLMPEVGAYSAGCQVVQDVNDFAKFMAVVKKSKDIYGNRFSYTLFTERQYFNL